MKSFLLLLLVSSFALSARITPNSNLPLVLHSALGNSLQTIESSLIDAHRRMGHDSSISFSFLEAAIPADYLSEQLPWLNIHSKRFILKDIKTMEEEDISSHFISQGCEFGRQEAVVQLIKEGGEFHITVSKQDVKSGRRATLPPYHEKRVSQMGLSLSEPEYLFTIPLNNNEERHFQNSRLLLLKGLQSRLGSPRHSMSSFGYLGQTPGPSVLDAFTAVIGAWQSIAKNFQTTTSTTLNKITQGQGFTKYAEKSQVVSTPNVRLSSFDRFKPVFIKSIGYWDNLELRDKADNWLELARLVDRIDASVQDTIFDVQKDGNCVGNVIMSAKDEVLQKIHLLAAITQGAFKLSPDVYIYEVNNSFAGGIYQERKEKRVYKARSLKEGDIKALTALTTLNAINKFTKFFKVKFQLPTDNPSDFCKK